MSRKTFGILIPCYNEAQRLPINKYAQTLRGTNFQKEDCKVIFLNDGSTDQTLAVLEKLKLEFPELVDIINFKRNSGKAETVRKGLLQNAYNFEYLGYLDADLATSLQEFYEIGTFAKKEGLMICFGSRIKKLGSSIDRKLKRHIIGRIFATLATGIILVPVYDTQCGAKFFHNSLIKENFTTPFISKWLFDIEIICRILVKRGQAYFISNSIEVPLKEWKDEGESKIRLKDFLNFPSELLKIRRKYTKGIKA